MAKTETVAVGGDHAGQRFANAAEFGRLIDLKDGPHTDSFEVGKPHHVTRNGWCLTSGEVLLANGQRFWAILEICAQDQGEHWGTYIPHNGEMREQGEGFVGFLADREEDIFPYRYRYDEPIEGDIHVGPGGWSRLR